MSLMWPNIKEELREDEALVKEEVKDVPLEEEVKEEASKEEAIPEDVQAYKSLDDVPKKNRKYYGI